MNALAKLQRCAAVVALFGAAACGQPAAQTSPDSALDDAATGADDADAVALEDADTPDSGPAPDASKSVGLWTPITVPGDPNVSLHGVWSDGCTRVVAAPPAIDAVHSALDEIGAHCGTGISPC